MIKLILMAAIVLLGTAGSAQAQKKVKPIGPPARQNMSVEDIGTGNFLMFDPNSGAYTFNRCSDGFTMSGVGLVKIDGCSISLEDTQADYRVVASVNECAQEGKALAEVFTPAPWKVFFSDQNIGNNTLSCALTIQSLSIEDDATGSFIMLDKGTGAYTFTRCSDGFTISGVGVVKVDGCSISLEDVQADHRVVASINECAQEAKAIVEKLPPPSISPNNPVKFAPSEVAPFTVLLIDQNMSNNVLNCAPKK